MKNCTAFKLLTLLALFLNISYSHSQELIGEIAIAENHRNITNLSGALTNTISFHVLINKVKKEKSYETSITFFDQHKLTKIIPIGTQKKKPVFLAFHTNNRVLTLIESRKEKTIVHDVDYITGKIASTEIDKRTRSIFSHNNVTILVLNKSDFLLDLAFVKSSQDIEKQRFAFKPGAEKSMLFYITNVGTDFVDNTSFIDKGFINDVRGFYRNSSLTLIRDDKRNKVINLMELAPKNVTKLRQVKLENEGRIKKLNSFIIDDLLFVFAMERKIANLSIFNLETLELVKNFKYNTDDFGIVNKVVKNGIDKTNSFQPKSFFKSYFPQAVGSTYNAELYVGVNKTTDNAYIVQVGHVDKNTFRNSDAGNFWWNYPAFGLNYDANAGNLSGGFNLAGAGMMIFEALAENKRRGNFFEINLDTNLESTNNTSELEFEYFDLEAYQDELVVNTELKRFFFIPLLDEVRCINFDKEKNKYLIYNLPKTN
ncbi:MAG: hypothetical protein AAF611_17210 [Bacteroidota bacterium]